MRIVTRVAVAVATVGVLVAVTAAPAAAKGPLSVTITDPGGESTVLPAVALPDDGDNPLMLLAEDMGLWEAMDPDTDLPDIPPRVPGLEIPVVWQLAGPTTEGIRIEQHLYPQAHGGPLVHTEPGQVGYDGVTGGGWYRASSRLMDTLASLGWTVKHTIIEGAPAVTVDALAAPDGVGTPATAATGMPGAGDDAWWSGRTATGAMAAVVVAGAAAGGTGLVRRRRRRRRRAAAAAG